METKALRVFYRKSDSKIVWTHTTIDDKGRSPSPFASTLEKDLAEILDKPKLNANGSVILDANDKPVKLGGILGDYACIEEQDNQRASDFLASDENSIVDGKLVIGAKRIVPESIPPRDLVAELDAIKNKLKSAGVTGF